MKILVGVDDSPHSKAAIEFVKTTKWPGDTRVVVLSAARSIVSYALVEVGDASWTKAAEDEVVHEAEELTSSVERELRAAGLTTEARVVRGDPREALVDAARTWGADLIVVGSHGRTGLNKVLMGSVASHVVTHAPCTVVVVKLKK